MTKISLIPVFLWLFLPFIYGNGIPIEMVGQKTALGRPGSATTLVFRVENTTPEDIQLKPNWSLPPGWTAIADDSPFLLPSGKSTLKLLSIHIPLGAIAGIYAVRFEVNSLFGTSYSNNLSIDFEIEEVKQFRLTPADVPEFVEAGEVIHGTFILQNLGNVGKDVQVFAQNCELVGKSALYFDPNESKVLLVKAKTLPALRRSGRTLLTLEVRSKNGQDTVAYISKAVRVVPKARFEIEEGRHLPVSIRVSHLTRKWADGRVTTGLQGEIHASGALDEAGETKVELRLRGPNRFGLSMLGQYDEYFASFENTKAYAFLGDKTFSLSPMTEFSRYGRGAEASLKINRSTFGGFYHKPRFFPEIEEQVAGYYHFHGAGGSQISANLLQKKYSEERGDAMLASVYGSFIPIKQTTVEAELTRGYYSKVWGNGFFLNVNSYFLNKIMISSNFIYADKNYPGYYNSTISFYGQAGYQVSRKLNVSLLFNEDEKNAERDTFFAVSPYSKLMQMGLSYNLSKGFSVLGYVQKMALEDRMPGRKFNFVEDILRLQATKKWEDIQLSLTGEYGIREDLLKLPDERISNTTRSFFNASYRLGQGHSVQCMVQYFNYYSEATGKNQTWIFGGSLNSEVSAFTRLRLAFQTGYQLEEYLRNRNLLDLNLSQKFGKNKHHEVSVSVNYVLLQRTQREKDVAVQANCIYNFGLRTAGKDNTQHVTGRVANLGVESVAGIVLSLNGQSVQTGTDGSFVFENIPPGTFYLMIDPTSIKLHEVPDVQMPMKVTVEKGIKPSVNFGLTKSVTIRGSVELEPDKKKTKAEEKRPPSNVFIFEITSGKETFRRLADEYSRFEFPDLRPGTWTLKILNSDHFHNFYFERTEWELELPAGTIKELKINLLRKRREIKFQDKLSLTSGNK